MATLRLFITSLILDIFIFLFGFVWYEIVFKNLYATNTKPMEKKKEHHHSKEKLFITFMLTFVAVSIIGIIIESGYNGRENGFYIGLLFWAVYAAIEMINNMFLKVPSKVQVINSLYWLIALVTAGTIFGIVL